MNVTTTTPTGCGNVPPADLNRGDIVEVPATDHYDYEQRRWLRADEIDTFPATVQEVTETDEGWAVHVRYLSNGYEPHTFTVKPGKPVYRIRTAA